MRLIDADAEILKIETEIKQYEKRIQEWEENAADRGLYDVDLKIRELQRNITGCKVEIKTLRMYETFSMKEHDQEVRDRAIKDYQKECIKFIMNKRKVLIEELQRRADENAIAAIVADTRTVSCYKTGIKDGLKESIEIIDEIAEQMKEVGE